MNVVQEFNALDGKTIKKDDLLRLKERAVNQLQQAVVDRINTLLLNYPSTFLGDRGILVSVKNKAKWVPTGTGLGASTNKGLKKEAIAKNGRLKPGFQFDKGGGIIRSKKPPKRKIRKGINVPGLGKVNNCQFKNGKWQYQIGENGSQSSKLLAEDVLLKTINNKKDVPDLLPKKKDVGQKRKMRRITSNKKDYPELASSGLGMIPGETFELPGLEELPSSHQQNGLAKPVSPDDIYAYVTDLIINTIHKEGLLPWQKQWKATTLWNGTEAANYVTKRPYRGINFFLLNFETKKDKNGEYYLALKIWKNPYFLTFNQIEKNGGKLKKGSTGYRVVYFTKLFGHSEGNGATKLEFYSYDQKKYREWIDKHKNRLRILKISGWTVERLSRTYIPILKYYNVFNAGDVTGINFGKLPKNPNTEKSEAGRIEVAEAIVKAYPKPPKMYYRGDKAFYEPGTDTVVNPPINTFSNPQFFYSTLFHELIHSTGHKTRLKRDFSGSFGSKSYAKEELIAEMGAVFLCAESGILFTTRNNSAAYLKGWNKKLVGYMEKDNRYFFRAASAAQAAADQILVRDSKGVPKYQKSVVKKVNNVSKKRKTDTKSSKNVRTKKQPLQLGLFGKGKGRKAKGISRKSASKSKKGLSSPLTMDNGKKPLPPKPAGDAVGGTPPAQVLEIPAVPLNVEMIPEASPKLSIPDPKSPKFKVGRKMSDVGRSNAISYRPGGAIGEFLGDIEVKPKGSVVVTLDAPPGAGKTRFFFQKINAFANAGYNTAFLSLEEHPDSDLFTSKRDQYLNQKAKTSVLVLGDDDINPTTVQTVFSAYDVIFTDSFGKLQKILGGLSLDEDIRKKFDGKLFFFIYQRTSADKMRGGADSAFDADIVSKVQKDPTGGRNHLVYFDKNRYEGIPGIRYNVNTQSVVYPASEEIEQEEEPTSIITVSV